MMLAVKMKRFLMATLFALFSVLPAFGHPAWGIALDDEGNVFFADIFHNDGTVWKLTSDGNLVALLKNFHAHNVNLDSEGNVITAHGEGTHRLVKISADGVKNETIVLEKDETRFFGGNAAISKDGTIFFGIRNYIWRYRSGASPVKFSEQRLEWNQAMYIDDAGSIYVPDIGIGNGTVLKLEKDGTVSKIADDLISKLDRPKDRHNDVLLGMTTDANDNFYIAETAGRRIIKISPTGEVLTFYRAAPGWKPVAIVFNNGISYIHEYGRIGTGYDFRIISLDSEKKETELVKHSEYFAGKTTSGLLESWICTPAEACLGFRMFLLELSRFSI